MLDHTSGPALLDSYDAERRLQPGGASLVRPDGYVAWRAERLPPDPGAALERALVQAAAIRSGRP